MATLIQHVRRVALARDYAAMTDGQLLESFASRRDEAAFAALLCRHASMVWGVCRRALRNQQDAEDAFQASFLVLVRKAASVAPREKVASWLYGVAYRTALKARALAARRRARERQVTDVPEPAAAERDLGRDLHPLLDQELSRLPDKHRAALVLCDLEGKTRREAAQQLGVPEGTVAGWLARARAKLAARLARRGVALSGAALAALLSRNPAAACVPTAVASSTIKPATAFAAGQTAATRLVSAEVAALTEGVLKAMFLNKLKAVTAGVLVGLVCLGVGVSRFASAAGKPDEKPEAVKGVDHTFPGKWVNVHNDDPLLRRVVIEKTDDGWTVQAWGVADKGEVAGQKVKLRLLRETDVYGTRVGALAGQEARWMHGFATETDKIAGADRHMTLRVEKELLIVEVYNLYKDDRGDRHFRCEFKKAD